jgi:hypothetical protein
VKLFAVTAVAAVCIVGCETAEPILDHLYGETMHYTHVRLSLFIAGPL